VALHAVDCVCGDELIHCANTDATIPDAPIPDAPIRDTTIRDTTIRAQLSRRSARHPGVRRARAGNPGD
jgi:hypothetical protein